MPTDTISVSLDGTIVTIDGIRFARELFKRLAEDAIGSVVEIIGREDGVVTLRRVEVIDVSGSATVVDHIKRRGNGCADAMAGGPANLPGQGSGPAD